MQDFSLMLDCMIRAVDEGHSYDGIVSTPELGLEDVGNRAGFVAAISRVAKKFFRRPNRDELNPADFNFDSSHSSDTVVASGSVSDSQKTHTDYESLQQDRESPARYERLPRRRIEEVSEVEEVGEKLPRRRAEEVDERLPRMRDREESTSGQSSR